MEESGGVKEGSSWRKCRLDRILLLFVPWTIALKAVTSIKALDIFIYIIICPTPHVIALFVSSGSLEAETQEIKQNYCCAFIRFTSSDSP